MKNNIPIVKIDFTYYIIGKGIQLLILFLLYIFLVTFIHNIITMIHVIGLIMGSIVALIIDIESLYVSNYFLNVNIAKYPLTFKQKLIHVLIGIFSPLGLIINEVYKIHK